MEHHPTAWSRVRDVFEGALALPEAERRNYVAAACGSDAAVRGEVERMLNAHGQADGFLAGPAAWHGGDVQSTRAIEGEQIGPYVISSHLGAGGMGEVYRARDSRLNRDVALKLLPSAGEDEPERLARFEREAQTLAALNHPNIGAIYGIEVTAVRRALVLELVEGGTLADRVRRGAMPVPEALAIARQLAGALEAAHEQGVVHRDLKPSNIAITADGAVKVLDFGLAKFLHTVDVSLSTPSSQRLVVGLPSPGQSPELTGAGMLIGTASYMAPEQARGRAVDKRADIWSFGVVLYEMLTGSRAFDGEAVTDILGAVIYRDVDYARLPAEVPPALHVVLRRCLQKDPAQRLRDMGDVRLALDGAFMPAISSALAPAGRRRRRAFELVAAACVAGLGGAAAVWSVRDVTTVDAPAIRFEIPRADGLQSPLAMSPDGRHLAYVARGAAGISRLHVHSFETGETRQIANTNGARVPFWSPDSLSIAFAAQGSLRRINLAGGPAETICAVTDLRGGTWTSHDVILFADDSKGGILQVAARGGTPVQRTKTDSRRDETGHSAPRVLPDGRHFLYLRTSRTPANTGLLIGRLDAAPEAQDPRILIRTPRPGAYVPPNDSGPGHLLFERNGAVIAQAFDAASLALGDEFGQIIEAQSTDGLYFTVSATGAVAYVRNQSASGALVWVDRAGTTSAALTENLDSVRNPRLSPDGRSVAVVIAGHVWRYNLDARPPLKLTFDGDHYSPLWTPDGTRILYEGSPDGLATVLADGSSQTPEPASPRGHFHPHAWMSEGREVLALQWANPGKGLQNLVRFLPRLDGRIETVLATPADEGIASAVSPDGQWLAYVSDATGSNEVWVRRLSGGAAPVRLSPAGGNEPVWARSGRELFYTAGADLMAVAVDGSNVFRFNAPVRLFDISSYGRSPQAPSYDVAADGRFLMVKPDLASAPRIVVVVNWASRLRRSASH